jgi:apolipoprotein D and lipocalin family protein
VTKTCHKGSLSGPAEVKSVSGHVLPSSANAKLTLSFLGGLLSQEYWIVDLSADNLWAIMATPNGRYVWLISRQPSLPPAVRANAMSRIQAMGFDMSRVIFPQQPSNR